MRHGYIVVSDEISQAYLGLPCNGNHGYSSPRENSINAPPQPDEAVKDLELQLSKRLALENSAIEPPCGYGHAVKGKDLLDGKAGLFQLVR